MYEYFTIIILLLSDVQYVIDVIEVNLILFLKVYYVGISQS